jgi:hypothetical protein
MRGGSVVFGTRFLAGREKNGQRQVQNAGVLRFAQNDSVKQGEKQTTSSRRSNCGAFLGAFLGAFFGAYFWRRETSVRFRILAAGIFGVVPLPRYSG